MNPFKIDLKEAEKEKENKRKSDELLKECSENAKRILSSEYGAKYIKDLEETKEALIKHMIQNANPDPVKDAFATRAILNKLAVIYGILEGISSDAR